MTETELRQQLQMLHEHLNILEERKANWGGSSHAPPDLLNQIQDYKAAIYLVQLKLDGSLTDEEFEAKLAPMNLVWIEAEQKLSPVIKLTGAKQQISTLYWN